jgi:polyphosphate kinase
VRGLSHRIRVRSIVGRFLEHSRIFYFENGGNAEIYLGSADWMPRNLYQRVEVMFPVKDSSLRHRVYDEILLNYLRDDSKSRILGSDGKYTRACHNGAVRSGRNGTRFSVQDFFVSLGEKPAEPQLDSIPERPVLAMSAD